MDISWMWAGHAVQLCCDGKNEAIPIWESGEKIF
jgi:hypothetical protein